MPTHPMGIGCRIDQVKPSNEQVSSIRASLHHRLCQDKPQPQPALTMRMAILCSLDQVKLLIEGVSSTQMVMRRIPRRDSHRWVFPTGKTDTHSRLQNIETYKKPMGTRCSLRRDKLCRLRLRSSRMGIQRSRGMG